MRHIRVAVPVPALEALTYRLQDTSIDPVVGARVLVPLGKRIVTGVVTGPIPAAPEGDGIKTVDLTGIAEVAPEDPEPEFVAFNSKNEMLDYGSAKSVLLEIAILPPQEIIEVFVKIADTWAEGRPQDDDMTFVVMKVK